MTHLENLNAEWEGWGKRSELATKCFHIVEERLPKLQAEMEILEAKIAKLEEQEWRFEEHASRYDDWQDETSDEIREEDGDE